MQENEFCTLSSSPINEEDWIKTVSRILTSSISQDEELNILFLLDTFTSVQLKERLIYAGFEHFGAKRICLEYSASASLLSCGEVSGTVIDVGYTGMRLTTVKGGIPVVEHSISLDDVGAFYAEAEFYSLLPKAEQEQVPLWHSLMPQIMTSPAGGDVNQTRMVTLPDGTSVEVPLSSDSINQAASRIFSSHLNNGLDDAWSITAHAFNVGASTRFLRFGGAAEWSDFSSKLHVTLAPFSLGKKSQELFNRNPVTSPVAGGSILSQLAVFKSMCVSDEDYSEDGPHGCVRNYRTDSR